MLLTLLKSRLEFLDFVNGFEMSLQVVVGRRAAKASSFPEYAKVAFQSLGEKIDADDTELGKWFKGQEEQHAKKLAAFHQFRALFAPLVENVILLDRL